MSRTVYIVHCIDTEGPLYEKPDVPFEMIKNIFNINIEPTKENLIRLQRGELDLGGNEDAVSNLLENNKLNTKGSWSEIDEMLNEILDDEYRNKLLDSKGEGWIYNWFCMDHVGFVGNNPRRRDAGYHNIYDHYNDIIQHNNYTDSIQFHHHPVPFSGNYNESATAYWGSGVLNEILARRIIDRNWFPAAYRPGFHTERPDSNWFLEQWVPFDFANQAMKRELIEQPDLSNGRFGDWRRATTEWKIYHPSHDDYQMEGNCRRWIARCLNMHARVREIDIKDIREAFFRAETKENTLLSFTNHDYKNMKYEIDKIREMIGCVAKEYPHIRFEFVNAVEGMRKTLKLQPVFLDLSLALFASENNNKLEVKSNKNIFGPQPFLALKTKEGKYYWDNFDFQNNNKWTYTFDNNTLKLETLESIGVAANSSSGVTEVLNYNIESKKLNKKVWNS
jgi:hypothetical protein